jgi:hypothetical protein
LLKSFFLHFHDPHDASAQRLRNHLRFADCFARGFAQRAIAGLPILAQRKRDARNLVRAGLCGRVDDAADFVQLTGGNGDAVARFVTGDCRRLVFLINALRLQAVTAGFTSAPVPAAAFKARTTASVLVAFSCCALDRVSSLCDDRNRQIAVSGCA